MRAAPIPLAILLLLTALAGCMAPTDDQGDGAGEGDVAFYVKDAPADEFESVFVTFTKVEVHKTGGDAANQTTAVPTNTTAPSTPNATTPANATTAPANTTTPTTSAPAEAGWITIVENTTTLDLKQFQGDAKAFLGQHSIAVGKYTQIRIHVDAAWGVTADGAEHNFTLPSNRLKLTGPWEVTEEGVTQLIVDFQLEKSIHAAGQGKYMFKPTIKLDVEHKSHLSATDTASPTAASEKTKMHGGNGTHGGGHGRPTTNTTAPSA